MKRLYWLSAVVAATPLLVGGALHAGPFDKLADAFSPEPTYANAEKIGRVLTPTDGAMRVAQAGPAVPTPTPAPAPVTGSLGAPAMPAPAGGLPAMPAPSDYSTPSAGEDSPGAGYAAQMPAPSPGAEYITPPMPAMPAFIQGQPFRGPMTRGPMVRGSMGGGPIVQGPVAGVPVTGVPIAMAPGQPLCHRVRIEDPNHIHPCAHPIIVQVMAPGAGRHHRRGCVSCGPQLVCVKFYAPPGRPEIDVDRHGRRVTYDYGDYKVQLTSRRNYIKIDYDD